jgi:hypothetical protein
MGVAMIDTLTGFYDRMHIDNPAVLARTIFIDPDTKGGDRPRTLRMEDPPTDNGTGLRCVQASFVQRAGHPAPGTVTRVRCT